LGDYTNYVTNTSGIASNAFSNCRSVTGINLGNSTIASIGNGAFGDCINIVFSGTPAITTIGSSVFAGCGKLTEEFIKPVTGVSGIQSIGGCTYVPNTVGGVDVGGA
jgi:hypothetical protein